VYSPLQAFAAKPLSQADIVRHTDLTNRTAFDLVLACLHLKLSVDPSHCPGLCPPGSLRLVLRLRAAAVSCSA
jgi:hypothetical protein